MSSLSFFIRTLPFRSEKILVFPTFQVVSTRIMSNAPYMTPIVVYGEQPEQYSAIDIRMIFILGFMASGLSWEIRADIYKEYCDTYHRQPRTSNGLVQAYGRLKTGGTGNIFDTVITLFILF